MDLPASAFTVFGYCSYLDIVCGFTRQWVYILGYCLVLGADGIFVQTLYTSRYRHLCVTE